MKNRKFGQNWTFSGHLATFCPLLKTKVSSKKPSIYAGLRAFWPLSHFFSLLVLKKCKIYKRIKKKKWVFVQQLYMQLIDWRKIMIKIIEKGTRKIAKCCNCGCEFSYENLLKENKND